MNEYEKIETLFNRNPENMKEIIPGEYRLPEFALIDRWHITEKIDGTNLRVIYQGNGDPRVQFRGRSDNAQLSAQQYEWLWHKFPASMFENGLDLAGPVAAGFTCTLYGEFYGPKIQSGGWYRPDFGFRVFDVKIGDWWLNWSNVVDVCSKLGVQTVPYLGTMTEEDALRNEVKTLSEVQAWESLLYKVDTARVHEGIVARTDPLLFMRDGRRLMWKMKVRDLPKDWPY